MPAPLRVHPDRQAIIAELHARPVDVIESTTRVRRLVFMVERRTGSMDEVLGRFQDYCRETGIAPPPSDARQYSFSRGSRVVTWEFHNEFVSLTWRGPLDDSEPWPAEIGLAVLSDAELIGATRIDVIDSDVVPDRLIDQFRLPSLCIATVEDGAAQVVTDFIVDAEGYTRFEFAAGRLTPLRRSVVTRRLLEIDTYRTMALLALPLARRTAGELSAAERELAQVIEELPMATSVEAIQSVLTALHGLSVRSGQLSERLGYRFAAAHAYGDILKARLAGLHEGNSRLGSGIGRYLNNRVDPALGTCRAMEKRLNTLASKIERAIELLNVRIGLDLQIQNKSVLQTIASTSQSQFRLQRTVEGLSVIAISYYALAVLGYLLAGPLEMFEIDKAIALSIETPFVVLAVWWFIRAIRRRHDEG